MALIEDIFKGGTVTGVAVGLGAIILAPTVLPVLGRVVRPAVKAAIKGGMLVYRETLSEVGEVASDLIAEARAELESAGSNAAAAISSGGSSRGSSGSSASSRHQGH